MEKYDCLQTLPPLDFGSFYGSDDKGRKRQTRDRKDERVEEKKTHRTVAGVVKLSER